MATERMAHYDPSTTISSQEMNRRLGVSESDLADFDEVEIEWAGMMKKRMKSLRSELVNSHIGDCPRQKLIRMLF